MDRQTLIVMAGFFGVMVGSVAINNMTSDPFLRQWAFPLMMFVFIGAIVGQEMMYRLAAAELLCVRLTIRPTGETLWLWVKHLEAKALGDNVAWILSLAFPSKELAPYGKLRTLIINAPVGPNKAIRWGPGEVLYKDTQIKHGRMTQIVVEQQSMAASNVERGFAQPVFYLREATNFIKAGVSAGGDEDLKGKLLELSSAYEQKAYEAEENHKLRLVAEEMVGKLQNELQARIGLDFNVDNLALIKVMTLLKPLATLEKVADALGRRTTSTYIKWLAPLVIAIIVAFFLWSQPGIWAKLEAWLSVQANQIYLLLIVAVVAGVGFWIMRRRRGP